MEDKIEYAARMTHEANRHYCQMIGDNSQVSWDDAPEWQKKSAIEGVTAVLNNPNITAEQQHANWMACKKADGWVYGPEKNPAKKEHPCMVPYCDLPIYQRVKDYLFGCVARAILEL